MSATDRKALFDAYEAAIEEENVAAQAMAAANDRYNKARDAAAQAKTAVDGMVSQSADAALHGQLDPPEAPAVAPIVAPEAPVAPVVPVDPPGFQTA